MSTLNVPLLTARTPWPPFSASSVFFYSDVTFPPFCISAAFDLTCVDCKQHRWKKALYTFQRAPSSNGAWARVAGIEVVASPGCGGVHGAVSNVSTGPSHFLHIKADSPCSPPTCSGALSAFCSRRAVAAGMTNQISGAPTSLESQNERGKVFAWADDDGCR